MTRDEILQMAEEANVNIRGYYDEPGITPNELERFYEIVAAKEREACAKVCEESEIGFDINVWCDSTKKQMTAHTANALAGLIRARGEKVNNGEVKE